MSKFSIKATELVDPSVDVVAMVKRGANRIPFRITKEDGTDMIDLSKVGRDIFRKQDPKPIVTGIMISKTADMKKVVARLAKADLIGRYVSKTTDAAVLLHKEDVTEEMLRESAIVKIDDEVALLVAGPLKKDFSSYNFESTTFGEVMGPGAFFPSICTAQDMLSMTILNIMDAAEDPKDAATLIAKAAQDFGSYVTTLAKSLPARAFKADVVFRKGKMSAEDAEAQGGKKVTGTAGNPNDPSSKDAKKTKKGDGLLFGSSREVISQSPVEGNNPDAPTGAGGKLPDVVGQQAASDDVEGDNVERKGAPDASGPGGTTGGPKIVDIGNAPNGDIDHDPVERAGTDGSTLNKTAATVKKDASDAATVKKPSEGGSGTVLPDDKSGAGAGVLDPELDKVLKSITGAIYSMRTEVASSMEAMKKEVATVSGRVTTLAEQVKKADEAVNGIVIGGDRGGDTLSKSDGQEETLPLIDTAIMKVDTIAAWHKKKTAA